MVRAAGLRNGRSKLTPAAVLEIRAGLLSIKELAAKYNVSISIVYKARNNKTWKEEPLSIKALNYKKLCEEDARQIRASRESISSLASVYGVSKITIYKIKNNDAWKHVEGPTYKSKSNVKLTPGKVRAIRSSTKTCRELAARYNVSKSCIANVIYNVTWKDIL